jgi:hypothetical protein
MKPKPVFDVDGFAEWWANIEALPSFKDTQQAN